MIYIEDKLLNLEILKEVLLLTRKQLNNYKKIKKNINNKKEIKNNIVCLKTNITHLKKELKKIVK